MVWRTRFMRPYVVITRVHAPTLTLLADCGDHSMIDHWRNPGRTSLKLLNPSIRVATPEIASTGA